MRRGLLAAFISATTCALVLVIATLAFVAIRWLILDFTSFERWDDLRWMLSMMAAPTVGCTVVCGCAAWATAAPVGSHRFTPSLAVVFVVSVVSWPILGLWREPQLKGVEDSPITLIDFAILAGFLMGPPVASAAILGAIRAFGSPQPITTSEAPTPVATGPGAD